MALTAAIGNVLCEVMALTHRGEQPVPDKNAERF